MKYILTFDVGTTSVKTCLFDESLKMIAIHSSEYQLSTPSKDIVELDPITYWNALKEGTLSVLNKSGSTPTDIANITLTTQGETLIPVDNSGTPLCNAVVWIDSRANEHAQTISAKVDRQEFYLTTGLPEVSGATPVSKVLWFKEKCPDIYKRTYKFLLLEDYLLFLLTGEYVSNQSLCSSTGYFDIRKGDYWAEILHSSEIDIAKFPRVVKCGSIIGSLQPQAAKELGLSVNTNVVTGAMDQVCSAIGAGNINPGILTETTGTALVIAGTTSSYNFHYTQNVTIYHHFNDSFLVLPYCVTAGIILKWFKDIFCKEEIDECIRTNSPVYNLLDKMASEVSPLSNGLIMLPYFAGKLCPDSNPNAKGVLFGLGLDTQKNHIVRAILESIGYMLRENVELVESLGIPVKSIRSLGGGSKSSLWSSIKADITGKEIVTMEQEESTSLGAAILGAVAAGFYSSVQDAIDKSVKTREQYKQDESRVLLYNKGYEQFIRLYNGVKSIF